MNHRRTAKQASQRPADTGRSSAEVARAASRQVARAQMRAEAEALRDDPEDVAASRRLAAELNVLNARSEAKDS